MKQTLERGLDIKLERTHDLSAIVHAERLADGRLLITTVPLLYGTYTMTHGTATFSLEPPNDLNFAGGWPLFKEDQRRKAEIHYGTFLASAGRATVGSVPIAGITTTTTDAATNELIRVEPAVAAGTPKVAVATPPSKFGTPASTPSTKTVAQNRKASPSVSPTPTAIVMAKKMTPTPAPVLPSPSPVIANATATTKPNASATPAVATTSPSPTAPMVLPALPVTPGEDNSIASTAGGGSWRIFEPGRMPAGRLVGVSDLNEVADHGTAGERYYLKGQFVVNFAEANRAVLRPRSKLPTKVFNLVTRTRA